MTIKFDPQAEYILQDERVLLRPLLDKDLDHLLPFALDEPGTWIYSQYDAAGKQGMTDYITAAVTARATGKCRSCNVRALPTC